MELKNKVILITGGTDGLGLSLSKALIAQGAIVHTLSRDTAKQQKITDSQNNPNLHAHTGDITDYKSVEQVVSSIDKVDVLINAAGIWIEGPLVGNDPEKISAVLDTNAKGLIYTTKAVLPLMLKANSGHIFNISSTVGLAVRAGQCVYVASKFAVQGFTNALKEDLKETKIRVTGFYPGGMNTQMFARAGFPKENSDWMDTDKVAEVIIFMLKIDDSMIMDHVVLNKRNTKTSN